MKVSYVKLHDVSSTLLLKFFNEKARYTYYKRVCILTMIK